jgi:hypothetical protein
MQTPNNSTIPKYDQGPVAELLASCNALELSQVTHEHLSLFAEQCNATPAQQARLHALWTGQVDVSPELLRVLSEITWPIQRERLRKFLGGNLADGTLDQLASQWK